jgi:hypothetical protein
VHQIKDNGVHYGPQTMRDGCGLATTTILERL